MTKLLSDSLTQDWPPIKNRWNWPADYRFWKASPKLNSDNLKNMMLCYATMILKRFRIDVIRWMPWIPMQLSIQQRKSSWKTACFCVASRFMLLVGSKIEWFHCVTMERWRIARKSDALQTSHYCQARIMAVSRKRLRERLTQCCVKCHSCCTHYIHAMPCMKEKSCTTHTLFFGLSAVRSINLRFNS